jgi:nitroreductase
MIHKPAPADAPIHDLIRERWSPRAFSPQPVSDADLRTILEAARWAASSYNEQPWRFIVARKSDKQAFEKLLSLLVPFNQGWAKKADVLIIVAAHERFTHNGSPNYYALHDAGAATAHILLQAAALGLQGHGMAGFDHERARKELGFPSDYVPGAAIAIGHPGAPEEADEPYRERERAPRQRKPLSELAFLGSWDTPLTFK